MLATFHSLFCLRGDRPKGRRFDVTGFIVSGCGVSDFGDANHRRRELPAAPGSRVYVTESLDRVTAQITANLAADLSPL